MNCRFQTNDTELHERLNSLATIDYLMALSNFQTQKLAFKKIYKILDKKIYDEQLKGDKKSQKLFFNLKHIKQLIWLNGPSAPKADQTIERFSILQISKNREQRKKSKESKL